MLCDEGLDVVERIMQRKATETPQPLAGQMLTEHLNTGGKRLRARLALTAARALGQPRDRWLEWAAAVELMHNATLIHDDIQDGDRLRRGKETTWVRYGVPQAINAGDLGLMLPFLLISDIETSDSNRWVLARLLAEHRPIPFEGRQKKCHCFPMSSLTNRHIWNA